MTARFFPKAGYLFFNHCRSRGKVCNNGTLFLDALLVFSSGSDADTLFPHEAMTLADTPGFHSQNAAGHYLLAVQHHKPMYGTHELVCFATPAHALRDG